jgi:hypothetical protein
MATVHSPLTDAFRRDGVVWIVAGGAALVHILFAGRYDFFRNELYFIICGRHPDFGYVDQPPIIPLISAGTQLFGENLWLLRLPAVIAAVCLILLTTAFCRLLGGGKIAAMVAAIAAGVAPLLVALTNNLGTSTFEPLAWTGVAYLVARAVLENDRRALVWAGVLVGVALETKYGILIWLIGLAIGVLVSSNRRILSFAELWLGVGMAFVIALPNLLWQAAHNWPFLELVHNDTSSGRNLTGTPLEFGLNQFLLLNPFLAPLWLAGLIAPFLGTRLRTARFLAIAFICSLAVILLTHGKDYYLAGAYPALFATGAVACERLVPWLRAIWLTAIIASSLVLAPIMLPILDPPILARYLVITHLAPKPSETPGIGAPLTQLFSDEVGWRILEQQVAGVYRSLSPEDQAHATIITMDYGEAAALDFFGPKDHLPAALCGQNQYYLWGTHGSDGNLILHVNGDLRRWSRVCAESRIVGHFGAPYVMPYENDRPIILCRGTPVPLTEVWYRFKRFN